jgi:hypothetical protein
MSRTIENNRMHHLAIVAIVVACLLPLIWLGDTHWLNDEPHNLYLAHHWNTWRGHTLGIPTPFSLATVGTESSKGISHGPGVIWSYQLLLATSGNLYVLLAVRILVFMGFTAAVLFWLSRTCKLSAWFVPVILLSPWIWLFSREFWDNSVPLSAMLLAAYASFLVTRSRVSIATTTVCAILLFLTHLTGIGMVIPVALHLLFFRTRSLLMRKWTLLATLAAGATLAWPYLYVIYMQWRPGEAGRQISIWPCLLFPMLGAHHLTATGLGDALGDWPYTTNGWMPYILIVAQWITALAYIAVWSGMALALPRAWRVLRRKPNCTVLDHIATVSLAAWFFQTLLDGTQRLKDFPHYYNATWIAYVIFAWLAIDALPRARWAMAVFVAYAVSLALSTVAVAVFLHHNGGVRSFGFGTTMGRQIEIAREIARYSPDSVVDFQFAQWDRFPVGYQTLRLFLPAPDPHGPRRHLAVQYRNRFPGDASIELIDLGPLPAPATQREDH